MRYTVDLKAGDHMPYTIQELKSMISPIAQDHGVKSVSLFGSYAKGYATVESDVDLVTSEASDPAFLKMIEKDEVLLYETAG